MSSKRNPSHGARHGPFVRQTMYFKAHDMLRKSRSNKNGNCEKILKGVVGMSNTESLCQILGGLKNKSNNMTHLHWKIIPTWVQLMKEVDTKFLEIFSEQRVFKDH